MCQNRRLPCRPRVVSSPSLVSPIRAGRRPRAFGVWALSTPAAKRCATRDALKSSHASIVDARCLDAAPKGGRGYRPPPPTCAMYLTQG